MQNNNSKLVYSTDSPLPRKGKKPKKNTGPALPFAEQKVIIKHDRKARRGESVTVIEGIQMQQKEMKSLLKQLKAMLGTGGAIKDDSIEIQGEHCDKIKTELEKMGFRPKRSGG